MVNDDNNDIFDPDFLNRLRKIFFKLKKRRKLQKKGTHATPAAGFTREFKDRRQYTPGDDFRSIDWKLYARLERVFIRIFEEVQEFHIHILLDRSASMAEPFPEKRITCLRLAVALTYLGLVNDHRVSLFSIADDVRRELQPLKGQGHIHAVLKRMESLAFGGATDLAGNMKQFRPSRTRRGIIFLLSDLYGSEIGTAPEAITRSAAWPAETHVIHIVHPGEQKPDLSGEVKLECVETGEVRKMRLTKREQAQYIQSFNGYLDTLRNTCVQRKVDYVSWFTDQSFEEMFMDLLSRGSALAGA